MPLPETITAKISSEAAGYVSLTPVERRHMSLVELIEQILGVTGKDERRIRDILGRGVFVSGSARYRWQAIEAGHDDLRSLLDLFPDPDPGRPLDAAKCRLVILRAARGSLELSHEVASKRRLLKRQSFWDVLIPALEAQSPTYQSYSYSERADVYGARLPLETVRTLQSQGSLLKYTTLIQQLQRLEIRSAELFIER